MHSLLSCFLMATCAVAVYAYNMGSDYSGYTKVEGNCPGSPISEHSVKDGEDCAELCTAEPRCVGFTLGNAVVNEGRMCLLKSEACSEPQASSDFTFHSKQTKNALVAGYYEVREEVPAYPWYAPAAPAFYPPPPPPPPAPSPYFNYGSIPGFTRANGNCVGNFLSGVLALPLEQCAAQCMSTPGCAGFSFNFHAAFPQCILKQSSCAYPDPSAVFTFFCRNGFQGSYPPPPPPPPPPAYPPYPAPYYPAPFYPGPEVFVPEYPPYPYQPWTKSARKFFKESNEICTGRILRAGEDLDIDKCADACLAEPQCTGISFDNSIKNAPFSCTLRAEPCQSKTNSTRFIYLERQLDVKSIDQDYLQAIDGAVMSQLPESAPGKRSDAPAFFDLQKFFQRPHSPTAAHIVNTDETKKH